MNKLTSGGNPPVTYGSSVVLGKQGEYGQTFEYDYSDWVNEFGDGGIGWTMKRPTDTAPYLLPFTDSDNVAVITLSESDLQFAGHGEMEIFFINTGETQKRISQKFITMIFDTMQDMEDVPEPWQPYVDSVAEMYEYVKTAREEIEEVRFELTDDGYLEVII